MLESLLYLKNYSFLEFFIQIIILYNLLQLFKQIHFFYILAYFLNFIFFSGLSFILYTLDLGVIILWIVYGGVVIIFFLYSTMWVELLKTNIYSWNKRFLVYMFLILYFFFLYFFFLDFEFFYNINLFTYCIWINYYNLLIYDIFEELEGLGIGLLQYTTFFLYLSIIFLFFACCIVVILILTTKRIKYSISIQKEINFNIIYRVQNFFLQEYEENFKKFSQLKNYKILVKFHRLKNLTRRV